MMRFRRFWPLLFVVAALCGALWGAWSSAQNYKQNNHTESTAYEKPIEIPLPGAGGWTAIFTFFLTLSTLLLWGVTRTSANAAKAAAESLPILERAYLFFDKVTDIGFEFIPSVIGQNLYGDIHGPDICVPKGGGLGFDVVNRGRTPAVITEVMGKSAFLQRFGTDLPPPIDVATERGDRSPPHVSVGITAPLGLHCFPDFRNPLMTATQADEQRLFVLGYVRYTDIFRKRHRIGFCLQYVPSVPTFGVIGEDGYNYTTDED